MDFKVLYTEPALADLEAIMDWSWAKHPEITERFANSILDHVDLLKNFPRMGTLVRGYPGVRRFLHSPFHVYYRIHETGRVVEILHFWHSSRKIPGL